jgi:predicted O-methyltransferase YrrM
MDPDVWTSVDLFLERTLLAPDPALDAALQDSADAGLPAIQVPALQGKLLNLLARSVQARSILEIGTLGGYSTIWLARALPADGRLVSLEVSQAHADVARANLDRAGVGARVEVRVGPALETLATMESGVFDVTFIDADKTSTREYFDWAVAHSRPGALVIVDNVVRQGAVTDDDSTDVNVQGIRAFLAAAGKDPRVDVTAVQTVGAKGYDGFAVALVQ